MEKNVSVTNSKENIEKDVTRWSNEKYKTFLKIRSAMSLQVLKFTMNSGKYNRTAKLNDCQRIHKSQTHVAKHSMS